MPVNNLLKNAIDAVNQRNDQIDQMVEGYRKQANDTDKSIAENNAQLEKANIPGTKIDLEKPERATTYQDLYTQYMKKPLTPEQEDQRKRAATAVNGIASFGNIANAFANLIYTGKNAPNMTLPKYQGADLQAFSDKAADARRMYADSYAKGLQLDDNTYRQAQQMYNQGVSQNNAVDQQAFQNQAAINTAKNNAANTSLAHKQEAIGLNQAERNARNQQYQQQFSNEMQKESLGIQAANAAVQRENARLNGQLLKMNIEDKEASRKGYYEDGTPYTGTNGNSKSGNSYGYGGNSKRSQITDINGDSYVYDRDNLNNSIAVSNTVAAIMNSGAVPNDEIEEYKSQRDFVSSTKDKIEVDKDFIGRAAYYMTPKLREKIVGVGKAFTPVKKQQTNKRNSKDIIGMVGNNDTVKDYRKSY